MITIREERSSDIGQVYEVNLFAFGNVAEANLVDALRQLETYIGLVPEQDGQVVGHISFNGVSLDDLET